MRSVEYGCVNAARDVQKWRSKGEKMPLIKIEVEETSADLHVMYRS